MFNVDKKNIYLLINYEKKNSKPSRQVSSFEYTRSCFSSDLCVPTDQMVYKELKIWNKIDQKKKKPNKKINTSVGVIC